MGAGYTRWFRAGGNIGIFRLWNNVPMEQVPCIHKPKHYKPTYEIRAIPVWPSNRSFFGLYDPKPQEFISSCMYAPISGRFRHTVHKFGNDIYFFQPDVTYIDEATEIKEEQWEELKNSDLLGNLSRLADFYRKEEKVPSVSKRQRFLEAGGRFEKPTMFDKNTAPVVLCDNNNCPVKPRIESVINGMHAHYAYDASNYNKEAWFVKDRTHNFENILQNTDENIWHAARNRRFYIKQGAGIGYIGKETMADKHLISTMRYLVAAWKEIHNVVLVRLGKYINRPESDKSSILVVHISTRNRILAVKNAPSFYEIILPCWPTLVSEFVERFGTEALTSVLDGN